MWNGCTFHDYNWTDAVILHGTILRFPWTPLGRLDYSASLELKDFDKVCHSLIVCVNGIAAYLNGDFDILHTGRQHNSIGIGNRNSLPLGLWHPPALTPFVSSKWSWDTSSLVAWARPIENNNGQPTTKGICVYEHACRT